MRPQRKDDEIAQAMRAVSRAGFLPPGLRDRADVDAPLPIGRGQTNSQPSTVAFVLRLLDVAGGQRVLDVGAGSGWTTALLAWIVGPRGRVIGVERHADLIAPARAALAPYNAGQAEIRLAAPGVLGAPDEAPFDRILVSAEARRLPDSLVDQLGDGGVMVIPVNGTMVRVDRRGSETSTRTFGRFAFVPLVED